MMLLIRGFHAKCEGMLALNNDTFVEDMTRYDEGHAYWWEQLTCDAALVSPLINKNGEQLLCCRLH